jgi:hypothetical protein
MLDGGANFYRRLGKNLLDRMASLRS